DKEKELSTSLKNYKDIIDAGGVARRTIIDLDGNETLSDPFDVSKETLRGAVEAGAQLTAIQKDIAEREAIIKSLTTGQKIEKEKIVTEIKKATGATDAQKEAAKKLKEEIEKLREQYKKLSDEINKRATEARVDINAAGAEDRVRRESEIRVKELEAEETQAKELAKKAKVKYDLDAQFAELRTVLALETAVKIRNARNKENGTDDEIKTLELRFATFQDLVKARQDVLDSISSGNESQIEKAKSEFERLKSAANPQDLIEFLAKFGDKFNELKIKIAQTAEDLRTPLEKLRDGIGKALGLDDKQLDIGISGIEELGSNLFAFFQQQNAAAAKAQEELAAQLAQRIGVQKEAIEKEKALAAEGLANSLGAEKDKLDKLEEQRAASLKKAEEERQKNVRLQLAQQAIEQTSNLITAGSNIIANFARFPIVGVILGIAALSSMLLAFSTFKSRVTATTKLRGGGRLKGNSHEFGGIDIGGGYEAEGGEWVVTKSVSEKHDAFINRLNNKEFDNFDLNTLLSRDNPVFGAGRSVRDAKKQTRQSVEIAQHNALKKVLREVIMEQTDALVSLENTRTHMVSTAEGYIEIKNDRRGGKTINKVRMV
ncbi:MAG: hypothetical protein U5L45_00215, partial [Saprospiraceae bacterium]|nr:hypothetical protein [Saprospiraceae bacterium]